MWVSFSARIYGRFHVRFLRFRSIRRTRARVPLAFHRRLLNKSSAQTPVYTPTLPRPNVHILNHVVLCAGWRACAASHPATMAPALLETGPSSARKSRGKHSTRADAAAPE